MDENLKNVRAAYYEAGRKQPSDYDPLPSWEALPMQLREAFIHVWYDGHRTGAHGQQWKSEQW
jgi:hypothetical protein